MIPVEETLVTFAVESDGFDIALVSPTMQLTLEQTDMLRVMSARAGAGIDGTTIRNLARVGSTPPTKAMFRGLIKKLRNDRKWSELLQDNGQHGRFKLWFINKESLEAELRMHGTSLSRLSGAAPMFVEDDSPEIGSIALIPNRLSPVQLSAMHRINARTQAKNLEKELDADARADRRKNPPKQLPKPKR